MKVYITAKVVQGFKILSVEDLEAGGARLKGPGESVEVDRLYMDRHRPKVGGYFVQYPDGYRSWSPAEAWERSAREIGVHEFALIMEPHGPEPAG